MTGPTDQCQLTLVLQTDDSDLAETRDLALRLRDELLTADGFAAEFQPSERVAPPNAKSPLVVTSDPILLTLAVTALPSLIVLIQQWLLRQQSQTLKVKIGEVELEVPRNASQAEIDRIVNAVRRIAPSPRTPAKSK